MSLNVNVNIDWKAILAFGASSSLIILSVKINSEESSKVLSTIGNSVKDCVITLTSNR